MANNLYRVLEVYKGQKICMVNYNNFCSMYIGVEVDGCLSSIALTSRKAAKNVIDTHIRSQKQ